MKVVWPANGSPIELHILYKHPSKDARDTVKTILKSRETPYKGMADESLDRFFIS